MLEVDALPRIYQHSAVTCRQYKLNKSTKISKGNLDGRNTHTIPQCSLAEMARSNALHLFFDDIAELQGGILSC